MNRIILSALNAPLFYLIVTIGVALQTSLFNSYPFLYLQPDVILLAVIWCGLRRNFYEGGILTLLFALLGEIHSSTPQGLFMACYMAVYLSVRLINRLFVIPNLSSVVILTLFASIGWKLLHLFILHLMDLSGNQWRHTLVLLLPGAVMEAIVAMWAYQGLERFDQATFKIPRVKGDIEDDLAFEPGEEF